MEKQDFEKLTDEELLTEKKRINQSRIFYAVSIGFLIGILLFGVGSWILKPEFNFGFLVSFVIIVPMLYGAFKNKNGNKEYKELKEVLQQRNLN